MTKNAKCLFGIFLTTIMLCGLNGCGSNNDVNPAAPQEQERIQSTGISETQNIVQDTSSTASDTSSGEDLDVTAPSTADDDWYRKGNVYTDESGHRLEVFYDDEGMLNFAVDGLSLYYTTVNNYQLENDWRIYTCDDGTTIIYYPKEPAHLEICDGDYAGIYEAGGDKVN